MISPMRSRRDDAGASLIVTLMFIVIVSTFVGFLTPWMSNLLSNNVQFTQASAVQTDLGNAANLRQSKHPVYAAHRGAIRPSTRHRRAIAGERRPRRASQESRERRCRPGAQLPGRRRVHPLEW